MSDKAKLPVVLLIFLILISLSLAAGVFFLLQKERAKNVSLQGELEDLKTRQSLTEKKLSESQNLLASLQVKLDEAKAQITNLNNDLQQEKSAKQEALAKMDQLKTDLEQQKTLRSGLEGKLGQAQKDVEKIQAQLKDMDAKKAELDKKIKDLEAQSQGVELGKIVVSPETAATGQAAVAIIASPVNEGKVLTVNKDYDFILINLGTKEGVRAGEVFGVYHNNKYIGDVKIEKVHDTMSAAGFSKPDMKNKIDEGDKVVRKGK
ncbi:MAG: hypothetical protein FJZ13_01885 [Candidatus Omnitrophica bacterium]|nr:hypothetical protein [Candidatus Omnitrophota bacterium]